MIPGLHTSTPRAILAAMYIETDDETDDVIAEIIDTARELAAFLIQLLLIPIRIAVVVARVAV